MKKPHPITSHAFGGKVEEDDGSRGAMFSPVFQPVGKEGGSPRSGSSSPRTPRGAVVPCSLTSPSLYANVGKSTPTRAPSPITTPDREASPGGVVSTPSRGDTTPKLTTTPSLSATDESWESEMSTEAEMDGADDMEEYDEFNPYLFIKLLPKYEEVAPATRKLVLPKKVRTAPKISLVLDLDETLVHCSIQPIPNPDLTFRVPFNGQMYDVYVRKRPYLQHFLEAVAPAFEVTVFTASQSVYAETLLNLIDPKRKLIKHRLFREACLNVDGNYLKDLTVLGRDLRQTVLVDNSPHAFGYQVDNGIPIESWFEDPSDTELLKLLQFLKTLHGARDVRPLVRRKFRVWDLINAAEFPAWE